MFFFFFNFDTYELIKYCFNRYVERSFQIKGYCDVSVLFSDNFSKKDIRDAIGIYSEEVNALYKESNKLCLFRYRVFVYHGLLCLSGSFVLHLRSCSFALIFPFRRCSC